VSWHYVCGTCNTVLITNTSVDLQTLGHSKEGCGRYLNRVSDGVMKLSQEIDEKFRLNVERFTGIKPLGAAHHAIMLDDANYVKPVDETPAPPIL